MKTSQASTIDEYISRFPKDVQKILEEIRRVIRKAAPQAEETISYAIPTFTYNGNLVHFAAYKNHIGFYATPTGSEIFKKELSVYKTGKGSVQFPIDQPIPLSLIKKIVEYRVKENAQKARKRETSNVKGQTGKGRRERADVKGQTGNGRREGQM